MDLCVVERQSNGSDALLISFKPNSDVSEARGDLKLFFKIELPPEKIDKLIAYVEQHPESPYQIIQALFPKAFAPAVSSDAVQSAWRQHGISILQKEDFRYINRRIGMDIIQPGETLNTQSMFDRLTPMVPEMTKNALHVTEMSRFGAQKSLVLIDLRKETDYRFDYFHQENSTIPRATKILQLSQ